MFTGATCASLQTKTRHCPTPPAFPASRNRCPVQAARATEQSGAPEPEGPRPSQIHCGPQSLPLGPPPPHSADSLLEAPEGYGPGGGSVQDSGSFHGAPPPDSESKGRAMGNAKAPRDCPVSLTGKTPRIRGHAPPDRICDQEVRWKEWEDGEQ